MIVWTDLETGEDCASAPPEALHYALAYSDLGWPVLPVEPGGKKPLNGQGIEHASTDRVRITSWFTEHPTANIGIRLDAAGLLAVDIDPRNGGAVELRDELPATLTAKTGGGGLHLLYRAQKGLQPPGKLRQGVDIKFRGYVVVEPSRHPSGGVYSWLDWDVLEDGPPEIADAPGFESHGQSAPASEGGVSEGGRNEYLSRQAYKLRKRGLSVPEVEAVLLVKNQEKCKPPLAPHEVRGIAQGKHRVEADVVGLEDFWGYLPTHSYMFVPTRELWPAASVNGRCPWPQIDGKDVSPASWLDKHRAVVQTVWVPGLPEVIEGRVMQVSGWTDKRGAKVFNLYRPPTQPSGTAGKAGPWIEHVQRVFPEDAEHIIGWLAHRVQRPDDKCNHALVLGGSQGIGKDSLLAPVRLAVGPWNFSEVNPAQMLGRFNAWCRSVIVRVNEARDLGDVDRFGFYDAMKIYAAAPPEVLRVDEKHLRETYAVNVMGLIITTNHATDGLYLPADDRRHYVAWSPRSREDFEDGYWARLWGWLNAEGSAHVAAYLRTLDLSGFDAKAPPPKTAAFWRLVQSNEPPESGELRDVLDALDNPDVLTAHTLIAQANDLKLFSLADELGDRKSRRALPHKLERVGYSQVRNPDAEDGLFKIGGQRRVVYGRNGLPAAALLRASRGLAK